MPTDTLIRQATTANSYDAATRTFEAVIATMTPVLRSDAQGPFNEIHAGGQRRYAAAGQPPDGLGA